MGSGTREANFQEMTDYIESQVHIANNRFGQILRHGSRPGALIGATHTDESNDQVRCWTSEVTRVLR